MHKLQALLKRLQQSTILNGACVLATVWAVSGRFWFAVKTAPKRLRMESRTTSGETCTSTPASTSGNGWSSRTWSATDKVATGTQCSGGFVKLKYREVPPDYLCVGCVLEDAPASLCPRNDADQLVCANYTNGQHGVWVWDR